MPCRGPDDEFCDSKREQIDKLTRMLCYLCKVVTKSEPMAIKRNRELREWWEAHLALDAKRAFERLENIRVAALKKSAKEKLTKEELKALLG